MWPPRPYSVQPCTFSGFNQWAPAGHPSILAQRTVCSSVNSSLPLHQTSLSPTRTLAPLHQDQCLRGLQSPAPLDSDGWLFLVVYLLAQISSPRKFFLDPSPPHPNSHHRPIFFMTLLRTLWTSIYIIYGFLFRASPPTEQKVSKLHKGRGRGCPTTACT